MSEIRDVIARSPQLPGSYCAVALAVAGSRFIVAVVAPLTEDASSRRRARVAGFPWRRSRP